MLGTRYIVVWHDSESIKDTSTYISVNLIQAGYKQRYENDNRTQFDPPARRSSLDGETIKHVRFIGVLNHELLRT